MRVQIDTPAPFPAVSLELPGSTPVSALSYILEPLCPIAEQSLSSFAGRPLAHLDDATLASVAPSPDYLHVRLAVRLLGGKGGFGTQLRSAGGRMGSNRGSGNRDSCRTLDGRRLSSVKEAQRLAAAIEAAPAREAKKREEQKERLATLQREIAQMDDQAAGPSTAKRRIEDHDQFIEQGRETVQAVRSAVADGMRKKRKKTAPAAAPVASTSAAVESSPEQAEPVAGPSTAVAA